VSDRNDAGQAQPDPLAEESLASAEVFRGDFMHIVRDRVRCPDGHVGVREYVVHPGAVMVIPVADDGRLLVERQWRHPLRRAFLEFPAGKIDPGESLLACARRELHEETGYVADRWDWIGGFHNAIGYSDERIDVFVARGLRHEGSDGEAGEIIEVHWWEPQALQRAVDDGSITDVKMIIGLQWYERFLDGRRAPRALPDGMAQPKTE
jgi:ADP-ribose pyrophosphatase